MPEGGEGSIANLAAARQERQPSRSDQGFSTGNSNGNGNGNGGGGMDRNIFEARIETVKAQNDAKFAEVLAGIEKVNNNLSAFGETVRVRLDTLDADAKDAKQAAQRAEDASKSVKWNILATVFSTGLALAALAYGGFALWNQAIEMTTGILGSEQPNANIEASPEGQD